MEVIQKPKGTMDVYGSTGKEWKKITTLIDALCEKYNYTYIKTPTFERSELFKRGVGDTTDIVTKETYDFTDRGNREMTLKPEGTAGVIRSFIENKLYAEHLPFKCYYLTSVFRYERPQAGRLREHTQFGVEAIGSADPSLDAEVISMAVNLYKMIGLKNIVVKINTLGDADSRVLYKEALCNHFLPHKKELCEDCQNRLEKNPLRILDCKVDKDHALMKSAPKTIDYLNEESKTHFEKVKMYLEALDIDYEIDTNLVRGLDYYTHTVFEVQATIEGFGAQTTLCGGGRYNKLIEELGGPDTPCVGFGMGLERLLLALEKENLSFSKEDNLDVYIIPMAEEDQEYCLGLAQLLRMNGFRVDTNFLKKGIKQGYKAAERYRSKYTIIIGEEERLNNTFKVKNQENKVEDSVYLYDIVDYFDQVGMKHE